MSEDEPITEEQHRVKAEQYERLIKRYVAAKACPLLIEALWENYIEHAAHVSEYVDAELICIERSTVKARRQLEKSTLPGKYDALGGGTWD